MADTEPTVSVRESFTGCIAATWIGSSMGAVVEGWSPADIEAEYGRFDTLEAYEHYGNGWERPPGTTEDGIERQKLFAKAYIENDGRANVHDLVDVWTRDLDVEQMAYKQESFDVELLRMAENGMPPTLLSTMWLYPNVNSMARASHPVGLLNAGDPWGAAEDTVELGQVYADQVSFALRWAGLYNAALAEACRPDATVESVLATAREFATHRQNRIYDRYDSVESEVDRALEIAESHDDSIEMREAFYEHYHGAPHVVYGMSLANEVVAKGLAVFKFAEGDPEQAVVEAVNFGRDTDCLAAVAGGLAGALSGPDGLRDEWIEQVNDATEEDPYTNDGRDIHELSGDLYDAYRTKLDRQAARHDRVDAAPADD
jgi:ADP-ribosylglycohydrolase